MITAFVGIGNLNVCTSGIQFMSLPSYVDESGMCIFSKHICFDLAKS